MTNSQKGGRLRVDTHLDADYFERTLRGDYAVTLAGLR